jgi:hypothetical protein
MQHVFGVGISSDGHSDGLGGVLICILHSNKDKEKEWQFGIHLEDHAFYARRAATARPTISSTVQFHPSKPLAVEAWISLVGLPDEISSAARKVPMHLSHGAI